MSDAENSPQKEKKPSFLKAITKIFNFSSPKVKIGIAIVLSFVVVLIFLSSFDTTKKTSNVEQNKSVENATANMDEYVLDVESRLCKVIGSIKGVGKVEAFVYVTSSVEVSYANDLSKSADNGKTTESSTNVLVKSSGATDGLICIKKYPKIEGVLIVANGADNEKLRLKIINAVTATLGIENSRISVLAGN